MSSRGSNAVALRAEATQARRAMRPAPWSIVRGLHRAVMSTMPAVLLCLLGLAASSGAYAQVTDTTITRPPADTGVIRLPVDTGVVAEPVPPEDGTVRLTLPEAIRRALDRSEEIAAARGRLAQAEAQVAVARADTRPQITSVLSYTRTFASPFEDFGFPPGGQMPPPGTPPDTTPEPPPDTLPGPPSDTLPVAPLDTQSVARRPPLPIFRPQQAFPGAQPGVGGTAGSFAPFSFGSENSWFAGLLIDQALFTGGRLSGRVQANERLAEAARADLAEEMAEIVYQTQQAYYDAALAEQRVGIVRASLELAEEQVQIARTRFAEGAIPELELLRAEVERDNLVPQLVEAQDALEEAGVRLRRLAEVPLEVDLELETEICAEDEPPNPAERLPEPEDAVDDVLERPSIAAARFQAEAREEEVRIARAAFYPDVGISGTFGWQAFPDHIVPRDWHRSWSATLQLQFPIYLGGRRFAELRAARGALAEAAAETQRAREVAVGDYVEAYAAALRAWSEVQTRAVTVQRAERIYSLNLLRYEEGIAIQLEVLDALLTLQEARTNLVEAYHGYYSALARAERGLGLTPDRLTLPTGTCPEPARPAEVR